MRKLIRIVALTVPLMSQVGVPVAASQAAEPETFFHDFVGLSGVLSNKDGNMSMLRFGSDSSITQALVSGKIYSPICSPDGAYAYYVKVSHPEKILKIPSGGTGSPADCYRQLIPDRQPYPSSARSADLSRKTWQTHAFELGLYLSAEMCGLRHGNRAREGRK